MMCAVLVLCCSADSRNPVSQANGLEFFTSMTTSKLIWFRVSEAEPRQDPLALGAFCVPRDKTGVLMGG
jgi:hypothetical protein